MINPNAKTVDPTPVAVQVTPKKKVEAEKVNQPEATACANPPLGHTAFTWLGNNEGTDVPLGHTPFSWSAKLTQVR